MNRYFIIWIASSLSLLAMTNLWAISPETRHIADQLRCPVCRGIPIADSPSELAQDMVKVIQEKEKEGLSEDQILKYFEERYGDWILLKPKAEGMNVALWMAPVTLLAIGLLALVLAIHKWLKNYRRP